MQGHRRAGLDVHPASSTVIGQMTLICPVHSVYSRGTDDVNTLVV
jgi:hypothetical protein